MKRFENKTALIFGGGSTDEGWSNGKAAAVAYAREGANVVVVDLNGEAAQATTQVILDEGGSAKAIAADVTSLVSVDASVEFAIKNFGQIDVLHNNVGVTHMGGPTELTESQFQLSVDLNLGSVYRTCKAVVPHMLERKSGVIINISSLASIRYTGYPYFAYYATKAAVNHATTALAMEYARSGIRANCVLPGAIDTPLIYKQIAGQYASVDEMITARNSMVPLGTMGDAFDIANAALFLASDQAKFITGVCLPVDGGQSCTIQPLDQLNIQSN